MRPRDLTKARWRFTNNKIITITPMSHIANAIAAELLELPIADVSTSALVNSVGRALWKVRANARAADDCEERSNGISSANAFRGSASHSQYATGAPTTRRSGLRNTPTKRTAMLDAKVTWASTC